MTGPVLVFGAGGQLGRELVALLAARGEQAAAYTRDNADITNASGVAALIASVKPRMIVNAAAYTAVDKAESEPELAQAINAIGPGILARAAAAAGVPLIHVSTDYVFDGSKTGAYTERDPIAPLGVYGRTKAEGEEAVRAHAPLHVILRTSWVYGVHGSNFLKTMLRLARDRDRLTIVADQWGCPTVTIDLAEAILAAGAGLATGAALSGTYHFAGSGVTSWHGFAAVIVEAQAPFTGRRPAVEAITTAQYPTPAERPANSELNSDRFAAAFGYRAAPWRVRARETVDTLLGLAAP